MHIGGGSIFRVIFPGMDHMLRVRIKKFHLAITLIVLVGPILDLLTGYYQLVLGYDMSLSPGVVYRGLILTPILYFMALRANDSSISSILHYLLAAFVLGMAVHILAGREVASIDHTQRFSKILFPIMGFGALIYLGRRYPSNQNVCFLWKTAGLYGLFTAGSIVILFLIGQGVRTYRLGFSFKGFYGSQNALAFVFVASLSSLLYYCYAYRRSNLFLIAAFELIFLFAAFLVGTRAAIIGVSATIIAFGSFVIFKLALGKRCALSRYGTIILIMAMVLGISVYVYWQQKDVGYILGKFQLLLAGEFRRKVPEGLRMLSEFNLIEHAFGVGDKEFPLTENDLVDIYGKYGLLVLGPIFVFYISYLVRSIRTLVETRSLASFALVISLGFYIAHASLAGHAMAVAQTNNLMMVLLYLCHCRMNAYRIARTSLPCPADREHDESR